MDELYVIARRVLLDALEALGPHRDATILVGAQAIYLHTGNAELAVAEHTTDVDLALDPDLLDENPPLEQALQEAGFLHMGTSAVGVWKTNAHGRDASDVEVQIDLLVPSAVSPGKGRRAARLPGHDDHAARKVDGLEGVLVDRAEMEIGSLEQDKDPRRVATKVAGPGALLVAKLFKISERKRDRASERQGRPRRAEDSPGHRDRSPGREHRAHARRPAFQRGYRACHGSARGVLRDSR